MLRLIATTFHRQCPNFSLLAVLLSGLAIPAASADNTPFLPSLRPAQISQNPAQESDKITANAAAKVIILLSPSDPVNGNSYIETLNNYAASHWLNNGKLQKVVFNRPFDEAESGSEIPALFELYGSTEVLESSVVKLQQSLRSSFKIEAYLVEENLPARYQIDWPVGQASPGIRHISLIIKKDSLDKSEFKRYWHNQHAKIAVSYKIAVWNYSQNVVVKILTRGSPVIDGVAALHFRNPNDMRDRWLKTPWQAVRGPLDALNFMKLSDSRNQTMREIILKR